MQPNCKGSNVAYNKFMDIMRVMIAVAFKHIYCAFINLVFIKARYIIAHITFVQNLYYHLIFRSDFHDCLFIFVPLTPHCQSTYSSPLKPEHPNKCKEFPAPFIWYKWQRESQTQALTRMTVRLNPISYSLSFLKSLRSTTQNFDSDVLT